MRASRAATLQTDTWFEGRGVADGSIQRDQFMIRSCPVESGTLWP